MRVRLTREKILQKARECAAKQRARMSAINRSTPTTQCKICKVEVEMDLDYQGPGVAGFSYSCGCVSRHSSDKKSVWTSASGDVIHVDD